jgi:hypothetical protein
VTGRIIDADMDQRANIDRLTAQVATLKREVDQYEAQLQLERREGRELGLMYAGSNERLQESLTAAEQERDDFKRIVEVWRKRHGGAEDRVRMLEGALREVVRWGDKLLWSIRSDACGWIYGIAKDAITPAPPAASHTLDCNEGMTYGDSCSCAQPDGPPICPVHHPDCAPRTAPPAETTTHHKAIRAWCEWYSKRLDSGDPAHSGYEQDLFEAFGCVGVAPPAETPAPTCDSTDSDNDHYKRKWGAQLDLSAKLDSDNDRLRDELAEAYAIARMRETEIMSDRDRLRDELAAANEEIRLLRLKVESK